MPSPGAWSKGEFRFFTGSAGGKSSKNHYAQGDDTPVRDWRGNIVNQRLTLDLMKHLLRGMILLCLLAAGLPAQQTETTPAVVSDSAAVDTMPVTGTVGEVSPDLMEEPVAAVPSYWLYGLVAAALVVFLLLTAVRRRRQKIDVAAWLVVHSGEKSGTRFPIEKRKTRIGSHEDNDLVLADDRVARHHLVLTYENGVFIATDLNTLYGTMVAGKRIERVELRADSQLSLGGSVDVELVIGS
jgi:hypothetical protein